MKTDSLVLYSIYINVDLKVAVLYIVNLTPTDEMVSLKEQANKL